MVCSNIIDGAIYSTFMCRTFECLFHKITCCAPQAGVFGTWACDVERNTTVGSSIDANEADAYRMRMLSEVHATTRFLASGVMRESGYAHAAYEGSSVGYVLSDTTP